MTANFIPFTIGIFTENNISREMTATDSSIGVKMRQGVFWLSVAKVINYVVTFGGGIFLARLLFPEDYGLKAMAVTVSGLVGILGSIGTSTMLIQQNENFDGYANAGLRLNILIGVSLFLFQAVIAAPLAGYFYGDTTVTHILFVSAFAYLIWPFGSIHLTIMQKDMLFNKQALLNIVKAALTSLLSVIFAFMGYGVWSFIIPPILVAFVEVGMCWYFVSWRPSGGKYRNLMLHILHYGKHLMLISIIWYIQNNIDYILIGKLLGTEPLGMYYFGFEKSVTIITSALMISGSVAYPALSKVKDDIAKLKKNFFHYSSILSLFAIPGIFLLCAVGPELIMGLYGTKWQAAIVPFSILAISTVFQPVGSLCYHLGNAVGRPDLNAKWNAFIAPFNIVAIYIGLQFGIIGIAIATALFHNITIPIWIGICLRMLKWKYSDFVKSMLPSMVGGISIFFWIAILRVIVDNYMDLTILMKLIFFVINGIGIYMLTLRLFFQQDYRKILSNINSSIPRPLYNLRT